MTLDEILVATQPLVEEMRRRYNIANPDSTVNEIQAIKGRKYVRLMRGVQGYPKPFLVEGFVDNAGFILFGAYDGPYKYVSAVRGNVFSEDKGFEALCSSGHLRYL